jgi:hypothetical protein
MDALHLHVMPEATAGDCRHRDAVVLLTVRVRSATCAGLLYVSLQI